jgi:hypothetical protein
VGSEASETDKELQATQKQARERKRRKTQKKKKKKDRRDKRKETNVMEERERMEAQSGAQPREEEKIKAKLRRENKVGYGEVPAPMVHKPPSWGTTRDTHEGDVADLSSAIVIDRYFNVSPKLYWAVEMSKTDEGTSSLHYLFFISYLRRIYCVLSSNLLFSLTTFIAEYLQFFIFTSYLCRIY